MYLLNLLFDVSADNETADNGIFTSVANANPLGNSRQWLHLIPDADHPDNPNAAGFNAETANWQKVGGGNDAHVLISKQSNPGFICVRIAPVNAAIDAASTLTIFTLFGRPATAHQRQSSPFTLDDTIRTRTRSAFLRGPSVANSGTGWFFPLAPIVRAPGDPNVIDSYELVVGAVLNVPAPVPQVYTFGEDPEMDVTI